MGDGAKALYTSLKRFLQFLPYPHLVEDLLLGFGCFFLSGHCYLQLVEVLHGR